MHGLLERARRRHVLAGIASFGLLLAAALAWCAPALVHGWVFGSYDTALSAGLGAPLIAGVHDLFNGDQARQDAAWAHLNWVAVHHGTLPLWNPFSDLGLPELANFQSSAASFPSLVSYLFPLSSAYTVEVVVKLLVAGTGCYVAARVLGTSRTAALLAGVVGELTGPMAAWVGWPQTGVAEWTGWLVAVVVLACRAPCLKRAVAVAMVVGFAFAGGFPEVLIVLAIAGVLIALVSLAGERLARLGRRLSRSAALDGSRALDKPHPRLTRQLAALAGGAVGGACLAAPVWVPALPVLRASVSSLREAQVFFGTRLLALFVDPSYFGLPTATSTWFGPGSAGDYYEMAAFVGPLVLCLAVVAVIRRRRQPAVVGLAVAAVVLTGVAIGATPLRQLVLALPGVREVAFARALLVVCALLGVLAAIGLEELRSRRPGAVGWGAFAVASALTAALTIATGMSSALTTTERRERLDGLWLALAGLAVLGAFLLARQLGTGGRRTARLFALVPRGSVVVAVEAVTLVLASFAVNTWSDTYLPRNTGILAYTRITAGGLVALGGAHAASQPPRLGIYPELNAAYGVRELAGYDAVTPRALYALYAQVAPAPDLASAELQGDVTQFAPDVQTAAEARPLGVSYVLEPLHGSLHLVDDATSCVTAALTEAGAATSSVTTGILDDLEWLAEQPSLLRRFPSRRTGYLARYLAAEAATAPTVATPPVADGVPAAQLVVAREPHDPRLVPALEACMTSAPDPGLQRVATVGTEALYRVPGPSGAYFSGTGDGSLDSSLVYTGDATADVTVTATRAAWLTVAVDDEPGWSAATGSGTPLESRRSGVLLQVLVPAGRHVVVVSYWPEGLSLGLALFSAAVAVILAAAAMGVLRRRRGAVRDEGGG